MKKFIYANFYNYTAQFDSVMDARKFYKTQLRINKPVYIKTLGMCELNYFRKSN